MKKTTLALLGLGLAAAVAPSAQAATLLWSDTHNYGSKAGYVDPAGNDVLHNKSVTVSDQSSSPFADSFSFSGLVGSISSFALTLAYDNAGPTGKIECKKGTCSFVFTELWTLGVVNGTASHNDDATEVLTGGPSQTFVLNAATSAATFAHAVATQVYSFYFGEWSNGADQFRLKSATLEVYGDEPAPVPLPASGLLLAGAMGGVAAFRRRKA